MMNQHYQAKDEVEMTGGTESGRDCGDEGITMVTTSMTNSAMVLPHSSGM
jgi:hypothetical protein